MAKLMSATAVASGLAPLELNEIKPGQLTVFSKIGQGRFKTVSSGRHNRHGLCAILHYNADSTRNEARILSLLSGGGSNHIPEIYGVQVDRGSLILAQEISTFGSMRSVLEDHELACMVTPRHKLYVAAQLADAVSFLESMRVVHTDLACRNFLVFKLEQEPENTKVKITDFMNALCLPAIANHIIEKMPQATRWCAPETISFNRWSYKTDVWSLGAALWELFADGEAPWKFHSKRSDVAKQLRELASATDTSVPGAAQDLSDEFPAPTSPLLLASHAALLTCLRPHPNKRPSAKTMTATLKQILQDLPEEPNMVQKHATAKIEGASLPAKTSEQGVSRPTLVAPAQTCAQGVTVTARSSTRHSETKSAPRLASPVGAWRIDISQGTVRQESPAKASKSNHNAAQSACLMTPPTTCPPTPVLLGSPNPRSMPESPDQAVCTSKVLREAPSQSLLSYQLSQKLANLQNLKACLSTPDSNISLGNLNSFLSSPEAVCGLDVDTLVSLRRTAAAAQKRWDSKGYSPQTCKPVYATIVPQTCRPVYDTIVPLHPVYDTNSWYQSLGLAPQ